MTRDEVKAFMYQIGAGRDHARPIDYEGVVQVFERFAALVAAHEREAICELFKQPHMEYFGEEIQLAIRARGNA